MVQPTGEYLALMKPLAGGNLLDATVSANPALSSSNPATTGDLAVVSAATPAGVRLVVINRSPKRRRRLRGAIRRGDGKRDSHRDHARRSVTTQRQLQPGAEHRVDQHLSGSGDAGGTATITFPAHSISLVTLPGF